MLRSITACPYRLVAGLVLLTVLVPAVPAGHAQEKAKQVPDEINPVQLAAVQMASLVVGAGGASPASNLPSVLLLTAGEKEPFHVWSFDEVTLSWKARTELGAVLLVLSGAQSRIGGPATALMPQLDPLLWTFLGDKTFDYFTVIDTTKVKKFPRELLRLVVDEQAIPEPDDAPPELEAYHEMLRSAQHIGVDTFRKAAREDVTYTHLMTQPKAYRGEVAYFQGTLHRIRKFNAPLMLQLNADGRLPTIYEGWLFPDNNVSTPVLILFTELPPGVQLGDKLKLKAGFAGYSYKKYRVKGDNPRGGQVKIDAPLLIGRMPIVVKGSPSDDSPDMDQQLLPLFLGLVVGTLVAILGLTLWFRYHDMKVRQQLAVATKKEFVLPPAETDEKNLADQVTKAAEETSENWKESSDTPPVGEPELKLGPANRLSGLPPS